MLVECRTTMGFWDSGWGPYLDVQELSHKKEAEAKAESSGWDFLVCWVGQGRAASSTFRAVTGFGAGLVGCGLCCMARSSQTGTMASADVWIGACHVSTQADTCKVQDVERYADIRVLVCLLSCASLFW